MKAKTLIVAMGLLVLCASVAFAATKYSVTAHVVSGSGAIKAELQPVDFTIPAGTTGTVIKFNWSDPSSGSSSDKLGVGGNIYSITQNQNGSIRMATLFFNCLLENIVSLPVDLPVLMLHSHTRWNKVPVHLNLI